MSKSNKNRKIMETYYKSINDGDFEIVISLMDENVKFHIIGDSPFSGYWEGKENVYGILVPGVVACLDPETVSFAENWKIMCADDERVTGLMSAKGRALNGEIMDQTYCHIFKIKDMKIIEVHEFMDTAQNEKTLDTKKLNGHSGKSGSMRF
jgi:ketosteroid isomerase-like protein